jgi:hypothetical protein
VRGTPERFEEVFHLVATGYMTGLREAAIKEPARR